MHLNGVPLLELVRAAELPMAKKEGAPSLAGDYLPLPRHLVASPSKRLLGAEPDPDGRTTLAGCTCSVIECWPLSARIRVEPEFVTWFDFHQGHRDWVDDLGSFRFERAGYERALQI